MDQSLYVIFVPIMSLSNKYPNEYMPFINTFCCVAFSNSEAV